MKSFFLHLLKPAPVVALATIVGIVHLYLYLRDSLPSESAKGILDIFVVALCIPWGFGLWGISRKCGAKHPTGILCSRLRNHGGAHLGHVTRTEAQQWSDS
jgi:hypothetical protein